MKLISFVFAAVVCAQETPIVPQTPAPPELPPAPRYEFTGKPIVLAFSCTEEQTHAVGLSCPESEPCPVFVELAGLESVAGKLFLAGNLHSSAATFSSVLLESEDSGKTWTEAYERIPQSVLEGVQFADYVSGWAAGQLLATLPRDPFLLITTDGGKTWKKRALYDDTKVAAIDSFFFESPREGMVVVDRSRGGEPSVRSEIYETKNGGESWSLRETSGRMLRLKKTRTPPEDLRLRADASSKSYRIEALRGTRWTLMASFAVRLPDCKISLKELAPPTEPEPKETPDAVKPTTVKPDPAKAAPAKPGLSRPAPAPVKKTP